MARLADLTPPRVARSSGTRVMLDLRPLQEPARAPITAAYLRSLLRTLEADPLPDEEIIEVLRVGRADPVAAIVDDVGAEGGLVVAARRWLPPPSNALRSLLGVPVDALLLRAAQTRTRTAAGTGTVFHTASGATPLRSAMPVGVDAARPRALGAARALYRDPHRAARTSRPGVRRCDGRPSSSSRRGRRRMRPLVLVGLDRDRIRVVPLAADDAFGPDAVDPASSSACSRRTGSPTRYLVVGGRYDARSDLPTLLAALRSLRDGGTTPGELPKVVLTGVAAGDEAHDRVAALVRQHRVTDLVHATPPLSTADRAVLESGAVGHVQPALSDATGIAALEALAVGVPVIASRAGTLPEIVGPAGIIVEPREPARLANALTALWSDGTVAGQVRRAAQCARHGRASDLGGRMPRDPRRVGHGRQPGRGAVG